MVAPIRDVLGATAKQWGLARLAWLVDLQRRWPAIVGPTLAELSWPERVRGDTLVVAARQPAVAQELRWRERAILQAAGTGQEGEPARLRVVVRTRLSGGTRRTGGVRGGHGRPVAGTTRRRRG